MTEENLNTQNNNMENNSTNNCQTKKPCCKGLLIMNVILLIGLVVLYILFFRSNTCGTTNASSTEKGNTSIETIKGPISIAYVNTDSIIANYQYAKDLEKELLGFKNNLEKQYTNSLASLKSDFENYLKVGATLTLSEQKKKEESFGQREKEIGKMQESMMMQIQQKQITENTKLINAIYAFIRDYNQKNDKYTVIMKKSFLESPVLYIDENLDLTNQILEGLNKEYKEVKGTK